MSMHVIIMKCNESGFNLHVDLESPIDAYVDIDDVATLIERMISMCSEVVI